MQSSIYPPDTISEIINTDHHHHEIITPIALYTCIRAVIKLLNKVDPGVVFGVAVAIKNINTTTHVNIVDLPPPNNN